MRSKTKLLDFYRTRTLKYGTCWMCGIPEKQEIDEAIAGGVTQGAIRVWLIEHRGYTPDVVKGCRVRRHFLEVQGK